ncbi:hypothetical protein H696_01505 [Fonticula alba]|uniref:Tudor domain-containing protein n=1 Tax=Fonticula alba TaxID=691883 RepID=A0A058ZDU6_FONAL|nr:hypothetical protein H696_01505 [Fonticula alba]KCV72098.1 hypothetical protein H696_01505 [Fonticula alba]|eukprot:XP_009493676.1 hypothetical protein H696_01505 [Fonticula alba]
MRPSRPPYIETLKALFPEGEEEQHEADAPPSQAASTGADDEPAVVPAFKIGDKVDALYSADNLWYPGEITAISGGGRMYTVLYEGYNNSEIQTLDTIRASTRAESPSTVDATQTKPATSDAPPPSRAKNIPPTKVLKARQSEWQAYQSQRRVRGPGTGMLGKSIFSSPATAAGRVGVIGSGRQATGLYQARRHTFNNLPPSGTGPSSSLDPAARR